MRRNVPYLYVFEVLLPAVYGCGDVLLRGQHGGEAVVLGEGVLERRLPQLDIQREISMKFSIFYYVQFNMEKFVCECGKCSCA